MSNGGTTQNPPSEVATNLLPERIQSKLGAILRNDRQPQQLPIRSVEVVPSAQQRVWIVRTTTGVTTSTDSSSSSNALGREPVSSHPEIDTMKVVIREWHGGARWWNLHRNHQQESNANGAVPVVAQAEVTAYRLAHKALPHLIPRVLWYSADDEENKDFTTTTSASRRQHKEDDDNQHRYPWAVLEYVGPSFSAIRSHNDNNEDSSTFWTRRMIKVRQEFGFEEPHPRWGRLPIPDCLSYVRLVLDQVVIPLHQYCWDQQQQLPRLLSSLKRRSLCDGKESPNDNPTFYYTYSHMVNLYHAAWLDLQTAAEAMTATTTTTSNNDQSFSQMAVSTLQKCIQQLTQYSVDTTGAVPPPPVLVHMDLQPQNIVWNHRHVTRTASSTDQRSSGSDDNCWYVKAVLDWEDAAWADPRFEVMLLARKVCANRGQANAVWGHYQSKCPPNIALGPIDPWLHLETVHNITMLLLQSTHASAGRSPWEGPSDLRGKLEREFARLVRYGNWEFCRPVAAMVLPTMSE